MFSVIWNVKSHQATYYINRSIYASQLTFMLIHLVYYDCGGLSMRYDSSTAIKIC